MAVNRKLPENRKTFIRTKEKDEVQGAKPPQTFLECFSVEGRVLEMELAAAHPPKLQEVTLLNLEDLMERLASNEWIRPSNRERRSINWMFSESRWC